MRFSHAPELIDQYPQLSVVTLLLRAVEDSADVTDSASPFLQRASARLTDGPESEFPEIAAWRRAFSQMGLKPTQYRCASEALLRRYRKDGSLPSVHPLVDLCNAVSLAYAIPIAVFDLAHVTGDLTVRKATGAETSRTFCSETEHPDAGEVIFADDAGNAHARRWTNRQSALSAIRPQTRSVLIVSEAMHDDGPQDLSNLLADLARLTTHWAV